MGFEMKIIEYWAKIRDIYVIAKRYVTVGEKQAI